MPASTKRPRPQLRVLESQRDELTSPQLGRLNEQIKSLGERLATLADPLAEPASAAVAGAAGSPTNGYHSKVAAAADTTKWVQVDLGEPRPIDAIRIIPARPTDFADTPGFGFPVRFRVSISTDAKLADEIIVADHRVSDFPNPGNQACTIFADQRVARYIRVTADKLWESHWRLCVCALRAADWSPPVAMSQPRGRLRPSIQSKRAALGQKESDRWIFEPASATRSLPAPKPLPRSARETTSSVSSTLCVPSAQQSPRRSSRLN